MTNLVNFSTFTRRHRLPVYTLLLQQRRRHRITRIASRSFIGSHYRNCTNETDVVNGRNQGQKRHCICVMIMHGLRKNPIQKKYEHELRKDYKKYNRSND